MALLAGTAEHARSSEWLNQPQGISLVAMVSLPKGSVMLRLRSDWLSEARLGGEAPSQSDSKQTATFRLMSSGDPALLEVTLERGSRPAGRATLAGDDPGRRRPQVGATRQI